MKSKILSELQNTHDSEVLYIIGNGFDLAHGIQSSYGDFKDWCDANNKDVYLVDDFLSSVDDFWSDCESAMGNYDPDSIIENNRVNEEIDLDHYSTENYANVDFVFNQLTRLKKDMISFFIQWVNSIEIDGTESFIDLMRNAKYLSFNYTETLERFYEIPLQNICHIHGSRLLNDDNYIFGYDAYTDEHDPHQYDEMKTCFDNESRSNVISIMQELDKRIDDNIKAHSDFFNSLIHIKVIIVIGHSLGGEDERYFQHLLSIVENQPRFVFVVHDDAERISKLDFIKQNKISNYSFLRYEDLDSYE